MRLECPRRRGACCSPHPRLRLAASPPSGACSPQPDGWLPCFGFASGGGWGLSQKLAARASEARSAGAPPAAPTPTVGRVCAASWAGRGRAVGSVLSLSTGRPSPVHQAVHTVRKAHCPQARSYRGMPVNRRTASFLGRNAPARIGGGLAPAWCLSPQGCPRRLWMGLGRDERP